MTKNGISTAPSKANTPVPYTDHSGDYIPKISLWNERLTCSYLDAGNTAAKKTCCSDVKMIDRAIDKAYQNGVQSHFGIAAIQDYPCVTQAEMSRLAFRQTSWRSSLNASNRLMLLILGIREVLVWGWLFVAASCSSTGAGFGWRAFWGRAALFS